MKLLALSATLMLATGLGWATSMPEAQPANGWLIALCASLGMFARALMTVEVDRG
mgnify:FL=1